MVVKWEYFEDFVRVENSYDYRLLQKNSRDVMVGVERTGYIPRNETIITYNINYIEEFCFSLTKPSAVKMELKLELL